MKILWLNDGDYKYYFDATESDADIIKNNLADGMTIKVVSKEQHILRESTRRRLGVANWLKKIKRK